MSRNGTTGCVICGGTARDDICPGLRLCTGCAFKSLITVRLTDSGRWVFLSSAGRLVLLAGAVPKPGAPAGYPATWPPFDAEEEAVRARVSLSRIAGVSA